MDRQYKEFGINWLLSQQHVDVYTQYILSTFGKDAGGLPPKTCNFFLKFENQIESLEVSMDADDKIWIHNTKTGPLRSLEAFHMEYYNTFQGPNLDSRIEEMIDFVHFRVLQNLLESSSIFSVDAINKMFLLAPIHHPAAGRYRDWFKNQFTTLFVGALKNHFREQ